MGNLKFYNSLTKSLEDFESVNEGKVQIYNCGPTVYKRQHIGNMRRFLFSDFLRRSLEFFGYEVRDVTNITDVGHLTEDDLDEGEDKLEVEARVQGKTPQEISEVQTKQFMADLKEINIEPAHMYPKATAHIKQMQNMIVKLLEKGHAYQTDTGIYYDVKSFSDYGKLSGNTLDAIEAGARVAVRGEKKHPADFALWIFDDGKQIQRWDSPWGEGYPGWHIECSAMSMEYLDLPIDIHTGGEDNKFPHHENEIAQSQGATGETFVNYWMHNGHLQMDGAKLAKREGEQITLDTLKEKGFSPLAFRLLVFGSHYRSKIDFSWEAMEAAEKNLETIRQLLRRLRELGVEATTVGEKTVDLFSKKLANDLNTSEALAVLLNFISASNSAPEKSFKDKAWVGEVLATLYRLDEVVGVIAVLEKELLSESVPKEVQKLADEREQARVDGDFEKADELRVKIEEQGYRVEDTDHGPRVVRI